jgi:hypothetical protein
MPGHAERLALDQVRTFAGPGMRGRALGSFVHREDVITIHDFGGDAIGRAAVGHICAEHLLVEWSRIRVLVVVADQHQRRVRDRCEIDSFVPVAAAGSAVAEEAEGDVPAAFVFLAESRAGRYGNRGADGAYDGDDFEPQVAHVHVAVAAASEAADPAHVLSQHLAGSDAPDEVQTHVAVAGKEEVVGIRGQARPDTNGFLSTADVDATNDFPLPVELFFDAFLDFSGQEHVFEKSLGQLSFGVRRSIQQPAGPR